MIRTTTIAMACVAAAMLLVPARASAKNCLSPLFGSKTGVRCTFDTDCPQGLLCADSTCNDAAHVGRERARAAGASSGPGGAQASAGETPVDERSAAEACGSDRRCRIDRLKRKNRAQRHATVMQEEHMVRRLAASLEERRVEAIPRLDRRWIAEASVSYMGYGLVGGYHLLEGHLRVEGAFLYQDDEVWDATGETGIDGYHQALYYAAGATLMPLQSWFTPYVSGRFVMGLGEYSPYYWDSWGDGDGSGMQTEVHIVEAAVGVDLQAGFGLRSRLGFKYGYLLYNQARYAPGSYDTNVRNGMRNWMNEEVLWGVEWTIGWAF